MRLVEIELRNPSKSLPLPSSPVVAVDCFSQNNRADRHPVEPSPSIERLFSRQPSWIGSRLASRQLPPQNQPSPTARSVTPSHAARWSSKPAKLSHAAPPQSSRTAVLDRVSASRKPERPASTCVDRTCAASAPLAEPHPFARSRTRAAPAPESSRAAPCLQPSCRGDSSLQAEPIPAFQAEPIPAFLAKPICLSLSRQPAPVLCTYLPDCLSVSSGFATDQYVLGAPSGHRRPDFVPTRAHVARVETGVRARASWRATRSGRGEP
ncbi:hypothetical protein E6C27_scaffold67G001800 [Cucumis melo var. makuwa]|uniref:Uncharacterized protein n=1 Tax=Cucumis melo var. makuwa TaxID=1194695 RepID=A0A5A7TJC5_CUCMM|nr:hypothetical protein E6C27_scaffold67G001800 [Cucumis melo var. makuwa]